MAAAIAYPVCSPNWMLSYSGINITADISRMVLSIRYVDELGGRSGELEIELEDRDRRWQGTWFPQQGDVVSLLIGYSVEMLLPCGDFQIDDLEIEGPPDVFICAAFRRGSRLRSAHATVSATRTRRCYKSQPPSPGGTE